MHRRLPAAFVLVALLAALAGCSPPGSLSMERVDDAELADLASVEAPTDGSVDRAPDANRDDEAEMLRAAIENGSATITARSQPTDTDRIFRHDGRYYRLSAEEVDTRPGYDVGIRIDYNATDVEGDVVAYEDFSAADRRALAPLFERPRDGRRDGYDFGIGVTLTESEANVSELVSGSPPDAVRYDGDVYPIDVDADAVTLTVFRYESTVVADGDSAFATYLRDRYGFALTDLSADERKIVREARNGSYLPEDDDAAFASLAERFDAQEPVVGPATSGSYLVRYDGEQYWAEIEYGSFVDGTDGAETAPEATPPPE